MKAGYYWAYVDAQDSAAMLEFWTSLPGVRLERVTAHPTNDSVWVLLENPNGVLILDVNYTSLGPKARAGLTLEADTLVDTTFLNSPAGEKLSHAVDQAANFADDGWTAVAEAGKMGVGIVSAIAAVFALSFIMSNRK